MAKAHKKPWKTQTLKVSDFMALPATRPLLPGWQLRPVHTCRAPSHHQTPLPQAQGQSTPPERAPSNWVHPTRPPARGQPPLAGSLQQYQNTNPNRSREHTGAGVASAARCWIQQGAHLTQHRGVCGEGEWGFLALKLRCGSARRCAAIPRTSPDGTGRTHTGAYSPGNAIAACARGRGAQADETQSPGSMLRRPRGTAPTPWTFN